MLRSIGTGGGSNRGSIGSGSGFEGGFDSSGGGFDGRGGFNGGVLLRASCACDCCILMILPHSVWIDSHASLAIPVITTLRLVMSIQLRVM